MNNLIRRITTIGVSVALAGGALLAAGGSASAAVFAGSAPHRAATAVHTADVRYSPWIADQLALFEHGDRIDPSGLGGHHNHYGQPRHDRSEHRAL